MLIVAIITLIGIAGSVAGIVSSGSASFRQLVPFSSGLLFGIAFCLILPEAFAEGEHTLVAGFCVLGCAIFGVMETALHSVNSRPENESLALVPLVTAVAFHNMLDGWNMAFALDFQNHSLMVAFMMGMSMHKLTGGIAFGAIFRTAEPHRNRAIAWAAGCEVMTIAGAILQTLVSRQISGRWAILLLAATGGSFLYLGYHSIQISRRRFGHRTTLAIALLGFASVWLISLLHY